MTKIQAYRSLLKTLVNWDEYLLAESCLPGPRGNLELAQVVADEGDLSLFERYLHYDALRAPTNSPYEFLAFCGVVGLGCLLAEGQTWHLDKLRECASDPRWRMREGVALALQRWGAVDFDALLAAMEDWAVGSALEQRAACAALCEPALLKQEPRALATLRLLDMVTTFVAQRKSQDRQALLALKKGLGYCWSVAVAAAPEAGKRLMEKWLVDANPDIRWIMQENLKKNRLLHIDAAWVEKWRGQA